MTMTSGGLARRRANTWLSQRMRLLSETLSVTRALVESQAACALSTLSALVSPTIAQRSAGGRTYTLVLNHLDTECQLTMPSPAQDLLSGREMAGTLTLAPKDVLILQLR